jgi:hypothetical protein
MRASINDTTTETFGFATLRRGKKISYAGDEKTSRTSSSRCPTS